MQLASDFRVEGKHLTRAQALELADNLERSIGHLMTGVLKPANVPIGLLTDAVQAIRDYIKPATEAQASAPAGLPLWTSPNMLLGITEGDLNYSKERTDTHTVELRVHGVEADRHGRYVPTA